MAKTMNAVGSTSICFSTPESVEAYKAIPWIDLPEDDMEYNEVTRYIVGYKNIILLGLNGRRLATFPRRKVRGLAIDGHPVVIRGEGFKRIGIDDPATAEAAGDSGPSEDAVNAAVAEEVAAELKAEGAEG